MLISKKNFWKFLIVVEHMKRDPPKGTQAQCPIMDYLDEKMVNLKKYMKTFGKQPLEHVLFIMEKMTEIKKKEQLKNCILLNYLIY
jgi:hypothetical protein